jgi:hypothetical protein
MDAGVSTVYIESERKEFLLAAQIQLVQCVEQCEIARFEPLYNLGCLLLHLSRASKSTEAPPLLVRACECLSSASEIQPGNSACLSNLAVAQSKLARVSTVPADVERWYRASLRTYVSAAKIATPNAKAQIYFDWGNVLYRYGRSTTPITPDGLECIKQAAFRYAAVLDMSVHHKEAWLNLGVSLEALAMTAHDDLVPLVHQFCALELDPVRAATTRRRLGRSPNTNIVAAVSSLLNHSGGISDNSALNSSAERGSPIYPSPRHQGWRSGSADGDVDQAVQPLGGSNKDIGNDNNVNSKSDNGNKHNNKSDSNINSDNKNNNININNVDSNPDNKSTTNSNNSNNNGPASSSSTTPISRQGSLLSRAHASLSRAFGRSSLSSGINDNPWRWDETIVWSRASFFSSMEQLTFTDQSISLHSKHVRMGLVGSHRVCVKSLAATTLNRRAIMEFASVSSLTPPLNPYLLSLEAVCNDASNGHVLLLTDFCAGGLLSLRLRMSSSSLNTIRAYTVQLMSAVDALRSHSLLSNRLSFSGRHLLLRESAQLVLNWARVAVESTVVGDDSSAILGWSVASCVLSMFGLVLKDGITIDDPGAYLRAKNIVDPSVIAFLIPLMSGNVAACELAFKKWRSATWFVGIDWSRVDGGLMNVKDGLLPSLDAFAAPSSCANVEGGTIGTTFVQSDIATDTFINPARALQYRGDTLKH